MLTTVERKDDLQKTFPYQKVYFSVIGLAFLSFFLLRIEVSPIFAASTYLTAISLDSISTWWIANIDTRSTSFESNARLQRWLDQHGTSLMSFFKYDFYRPYGIMFKAFMVLLSLLAPIVTISFGIGAVFCTFHNSFLALKIIYRKRWRRFEEEV